MSMKEHIVVLQVKKYPIFDVFTGEGWENWTRIMLKNNKIIHVAGNLLHISLIKAISRKLNEEKTANATLV